MIRSLSTLILGLTIVSFGRDISHAQTPEYMKLDFHPGTTLEIKGFVADSGIFVATDLEQLDGERSPKFRAPIEAIDTRSQRITVLGHDILITEKTEIDSGSLESLKAGQLIEVKSKVRDDGTWRAKTIETTGIKPGVKLKVTLTGSAVDGTPPDTLDVSGFRILLTDETDVEIKDEPSRSDLDVFRELSYADAGSVPKGYQTANNRMLFLVDYRHNFRSESDFDLSAQYDADRDDTQPEIRVGWAAYWTETFRTMAQVRVRKRYVVSSDLPDSSDLEAHFIQLLALVKRPNGLPFTLQLGRQRFKEPREWLFDEYLDAARGFVYAGNFEIELAVVKAVSHFKPKFDTWTDFYGDLSAEVAGGSATAYVLARWDSDETRKREPLYVGARYYGKPTRSWLLAGDVSILRGEDKGRTMKAWALDLSATYRHRRLSFQPYATAGFAMGSGKQPDADQVDGRYRQTGYEDNTARIGGVTAVRYYGTLLDPELSNLIVWTGSLGFRPHYNFSVEAIYHKYDQHYAEDQLRSLLIDPPARPNGVDTDIGWGLELVIGTRRLWEHVRASWTTSLFFPGAAFSPRQERATLNRIELRITL